MLIKITQYNLLTIKKNLVVYSPSSLLFEIQRTTYSFRHGSGVNTKITKPFLDFKHYIIYT